MKTALITGATSGLGRELCIELSKTIPHLIAVGRDENKFNSLQKSIDSNCTLESISLDLTQTVDVDRLNHIIQSKAPELVILAAGIGLYGDILSHSINDSLDILRLNIIATTSLAINSTQALKHKNKAGVVVVIGSAAESFSYPSFTLYAASKAYVKQFCLGFNAELSDDIHILCFSPGQLDTPFRERAALGFPQKKDKRTLETKKAVLKILEQIRNKTPHVTYDYQYRLGCFLLRLLPLDWQHKILRSGIKDRFKSR